MELIYFLIGIVVLIVVIALIWRAGWLATSLAPLGSTGRTLVYIVALLILAALVWYFFGHLVRLP